MAEIQVRDVGNNEYQVTVVDGGRRTTHQVRVTDKDRANYGGKSSPEKLLEESFKFLLEREPASAILRKFDLPVIGTYFPEYKDEIRKRLT